MFKNKSIVMHVVDNKDLAAEAGSIPEPIDYDNIIGDITKSVIMILGFYMAADTARQLILR
jgi:hypothetical protein